MSIQFNFNDGGRALAGYKSVTGDCVLRSIAIASEKAYEDVRKELMECTRVYGQTRRGRVAKQCRKSASVFNGVHKEVYHDYILGLGFSWVSTMQIGSGCKVHLAESELPEGRLIVRLSKHLTAVIERVANDIYDPNYKKDDMGNILPRCVYGYYTKN